MQASVPPLEGPPGETAAWYANRGLPVFPLLPRSKEPMTPHGFKDATTNAEVIRAWWTKAPAANIGIPTGSASGWIVLDIDPRNGGGLSYDLLIEQHGDLPVTLQQVTGGGGMHKIFADPATGTACRSRKLADGLEIKGEGGYIVVAPSMHPSGNPYVWDGMHPERDFDRLAILPLFLFEMLIEQRRNFPLDAGGQIPHGSRHDYLTSIAGSMRRRGMVPRAIEVALGEQNRVKCNPPMTPQEVAVIAHTVGHYMPSDPLPPPEKDDGKPAPNTPPGSPAEPAPEVVAPPMAPPETGPTPESAPAAGPVGPQLVASNPKPKRKRAEPPPLMPLTGEAREQKIAWIGQNLGLDVKEVFKHTSEDPWWRLLLADGKEIRLGTAAQLLDQKRIRSQIASVTDRLIRRFNYLIWEQLLNALMQVALPLHPTPDATPEALAWTLVDHYLTSTEFRLADSKPSLATQNLPVVYQERIAISLIDLQHFVARFAMHLSLPHGTAALSEMLQHLGAENIRVPGWRAWRWRWSLPADAFPVKRYSKGQVDDE